MTVAHPIGVRFSSVLPKEGSDLMECEVNVVYKAVTNTTTNCYRIYFMFSYSHVSGKLLNIGKCLPITEKWSTYHIYHIGTATEVHHTCPEGTWIVEFPYGCYPTWTFRNRNKFDYTPTISLANEEPELSGKHYDVVIEDDMIDAATYAINQEKAKAEVKTAISWYKSMKEVRESMGDKALFHVILFNRKTEVIDFKDYIPAKSETDACMLAAQSFGKYDSNVHERVVKHILEYKKLERTTAVD